MALKSVSLRPKAVMLTPMHLDPPLLQERIAQLQQENSALVQLSRGEEGGEDGGVDVQGLVEKIVKLKTRLKGVYEKGHTSVDVEGEMACGK